MLLMARVVSVEELARHYYYLLLREPQLAVQARPGQFLHIRVGEGLVPFLRRPFSLAGADPQKGTLKIIFRLVGEGTALLSKVKKGAVLNCLGPLGRGFQVSAGPLPAVLLAGGIGVAPLLFLARALAKEKRKVILFYGAPSSAELLPLKKFLPGEIALQLATEDGSSGYHGRVTDLLAEAVHGGLQPAALFACGPRPMLQALTRQNEAWNFPLQLSLEERMACGLGACKGCAVSVRQGEKSTYRMVCRDGPVFTAQEVEW